MSRPQSETESINIAAFPPISRGSVLLIVAVLIVGGMFTLSGKRSRESTVPLFGGRTLSEIELDQIELAFSTAGLNQWKREPNRVYVPSATRHQYLATLQQESALPFALRSRVEDALNEGNLFESDATKRRRHQHARAQDLGSKISAFDDIRWASVEYDEQISGAFNQNIIRSASVVLFPNDGEPLSQSRVRMIQEFVRGAYAGMTAEDVVVTDVSAEKSFTGINDLEYHRVRQAENDFEQKITRLLSGYGNVRVAATVLNYVPEPDPTSSGAAPEKESVDSEYRIQVSIGVPESHLHERWLNQIRATDTSSETPALPTKEALDLVQQETAKDICDAVCPVLGIVRDGAEESIRVWRFTDSVIAAVETKRSEQSGGTAWLKWTEPISENPILLASLTGIAICTLIISALAVRLRLRSMKIANELSATLSGQTVEDAIRTTAGGDRNESSTEEPSTLREDLAELVESNPELAAQIIHGWIAKAA